MKYTIMDNGRALKNITSSRILNHCVITYWSDAGVDENAYIHGKTDLMESAIKTMNTYMSKHSNSNNLNNRLLLSKIGQIIPFKQKKSLD